MTARVQHSYKIALLSSESADVFTNSLAHSARELWLYKLQKARRVSSTDCFNYRLDYVVAVRCFFKIRFCGFMLGVSLASLKPLKTTRCWWAAFYHPDRKETRELYQHSTNILSANIALLCLKNWFEKVQTSLTSSRNTCHQQLRMPVCVFEFIVNVCYYSISRWLF